MTVIPGKTYGEDSSRYDSTLGSTDPAVVYTSLATPLVRPGVIVVDPTNPIKGRLNIGTQAVPVWRTFTLS